MLPASDRTDLAGVRVVLSRVTTFMECPSSDGTAGWQRDDVTVRWLDGPAADESTETRQWPNLDFAEDSLDIMIGPLR